MSSVNKVVVVGFLGKDITLQKTGNGQAVCQLRVATNESYVARDGQQKKTTEWHTVVVFGKQAEACATYLSKGRQIYVEGKIRTRKWQAKDQSTHYTTEIVASQVNFLGSAKTSQQPEQLEMPEVLEPEGQPTEKPLTQEDVSSFF